MGEEGTLHEWLLVLHILRLDGVAGAVVMLTVLASQVLRSDDGERHLRRRRRVAGRVRDRRRLANSQLSNVILSDLPPERMGGGSGVTVSNNAVAASLGIAILGTILRAATGDAAPWALLGALAVVTVGVLAGPSRCRPAVPQQAVPWHYGKGDFTRMQKNEPLRVTLPTSSRDGST
jgi:hypothetical protein